MIDFDKISELSMLSVSETEKAELKRDFENLISFAGRISEFDGGSGDEPFSYSVSFDKLREDAEKRSYERDEMLANAPETLDGFILVPKSF